MKQIVAIIKPYLAERVLEGLRRAPVEACSVREVKGYGRQKSYLDQYGDSEYSLAFLPKVEITLWAEDARVEEIVRKIVEIAKALATELRAWRQEVGALLPEPNPGRK